MSDNWDLMNNQTAKASLLEPVCLNEGDIERAAITLSQAFHSNPLIEYFIPDISKRKDVLPEITKYMVRRGLATGRVYASSDNLEGIAVCVPSERADLSLWQILRVKGVLLLLLKHAKVFWKLLSYESFATNIRNRLAPSKHWHLNIIGVDPQLQGKGHGSILLKSMLHQIDKEQLPCYLEVHEEKTVVMYRHYGFAVVGTGVLSGSDVRYWAMLRDVEVNGAS